MDISNILSVLTNLVNNNQTTAQNSTNEPTNFTENTAPVDQSPPKPQYEVRNAGFPPPFEDKKTNIHSQTVKTNSNYMQDLYPPNPTFVDLKQPTYNAPNTNPLSKLLSGLGGGDIDLVGLIQKFLPLLQNLGGLGGGSSNGLLSGLGNLFGKKNNSADNKKSTTEYSSAINNEDAEIIIDDLIRVDSN